MSHADRVSSIEKIQKNLMKCNDSICEDVENNNKKERFRGLFFETKNRTKSKGSIVVGINPGRTRKPTPFSVLIDTWYQWTIKKGYYSRALRFVDEMGCHGPILWTELVKCENSKDSKFPSLSTFRHCVGKFLKKEIEDLPDSWPIVALGREAHKALAYLYLERLIIGVPHPTGAYGRYFLGIFVDDNVENAFKPIFKKWVEKHLNNKSAKVAWFNGNKERIE